MAGNLRALDTFPEDPGLASIYLCKVNTRLPVTPEGSPMPSSASMHTSSLDTLTRTHKLKNKIFPKKLAGEVTSPRLVNESLP